MREISLVNNLDGGRIIRLEPYGSVMPTIYVHFTPEYTARERVLYRRRSLSPANLPQPTDKALNQESKPLMRVLPTVSGVSLVYNDGSGHETVEALEW